MVIGQGALMDDILMTAAPCLPTIPFAKICVGIRVPTKFKSITVRTPAGLRSKKVVTSGLARSACWNVSFVVLALG
ncbi:hypothetical protein D3C81_1805750 [compost metagenome]